MAGSISAFDANGEEKWRWRNELPMCASVLATGGDLVFAGEPSGEFNAIDARTGELLWQFQCGSGHHSSPTTYSVDGRQYIAVPVGWGAWAEGSYPACSAPATEAPDRLRAARRAVAPRVFALGVAGDLDGSRSAGPPARSTERR